MNRLPDHIADVVIAHLRLINPTLDERQLRADLSQAAEMATRKIRARGRPPTALYKLAAYLSEIAYHHTGKMLGRTPAGGPDARMLLMVATEIGLVDLETGNNFALQQAADAIQSFQRAVNKELELEKLKFKKITDGDVDDYNDMVETKRKSWSRDDARGKVLDTHIVKYDEDGWPAFGGYQPASERRPISEIFKDALADLLRDPD